MDKKDYIYTHIYINGILFRHKKEEILPFATTGMDLRGIKLSEISWTEKDKHCMISFICEIKNTKLMETESSCQELKGGGNGEMLVKGYKMMSKFWGSICSIFNHTVLCTQKLL